MKSSTRAALDAALWLALLIGVPVALAVSGVPLDLAGQIQGVRPLWLVAAVVLFATVNLLTASQWCLIAGGVRWSHMFEIVSVTSTAQNTLPVGAGPVCGAALLVTRGGASPGAACSTIVIDQTLTGLAKLALLALVVALVPAPAWVQANAIALATVVALLVAVVVTAACAPAALGSVAGLLSRLRPIEALAAQIVASQAHLAQFLRGAKLPAALALAGAKKALEVLAVLVSQLACGFEPSLATAALIAAALSLTTAVRLLPASLGIYEATVVLVYQAQGLAFGDALRAAVVQHLAFLLPAIGIGYMVILARQLRPREAAPAAAEAGG